MFGRKNFLPVQSVYMELCKIAVLFAVQKLARFRRFLAKQNLSRASRFFVQLSQSNGFIGQSVCITLICHKTENHGESKATENLGFDIIF